MAISDTPADILIVDDHPANREILLGHLEMLGHAGRTAENGEQALEAIRTQSPDMVLLDIMMPVMDGYAVLEAMKHDAATRDIPVVVISALDEIDSVVKCLQLGADDYLTKPFNPVILDARISACVDKKRRMDREREYVRRITDYNQRLNALFNSVLDGLIVLDKDLNIQKLNHQATELLQVEEDAILGRNCHEVFSPDGSKENCPLIISDTGDIVIVSRKQILLVTPYGREAQVMLTTSRLIDENGACTGYVIAFHDVSELMRLRRDLQAKFDFHGIVGRSAKMKDLLRMVERMAPTRATVLITGETGTGKELFASALHNAGVRATAPLVKVNLAALPENLLESELFGHVKGAFTGADRTRVGRFEMADGGTLFLDEIAEIPMSVQVKLLRVLQDHVIERVGDTQSRKVDVRIIAATNKDLRKQIEKGTFREDLYYRLNTIQLRIPSLRERREDIIPLAEKFLKNMSEAENGTIKQLHPECLPLLMEAAWPGNVRQLEHAIEYAWYHAVGDVILPTDLPPDALETATGEPSSDRITRVLKAIPGAIERRPLDEAEYLKEVLERNNGSMTRAAKELGIHRTTLWRKLKRYNLV